MSNNLKDTSWQLELLEMSSHKPSDIKLLIEVAKGFSDAWKLGALHEEYKRLKNNKNL